MHPWCTHERTNNIFVSSESAWMTWSNADFQRFSWGTSSQRRRKSQIARPLWLNWTNDKAGSILHPLHCMRITNLHVYPLGIWHSSRYGQLARLYIDDLPSGNGHVPWQVVKLPEGSRGYMPCPKLLAIALAGQVFLLTPAGKLDTLSLLTFGPEVTCWLDQRNGSHLRFVQLHSTKMKASDKVLNVVGSFLLWTSWPSVSCPRHSDTNDIWRTIQASDTSGASLTLGLLHRIERDMNTEKGQLLRCRISSNAKRESLGACKLLTHKPAGDPLELPCFASKIWIWIWLKTVWTCRS